MTVKNIKAVLVEATYDLTKRANVLFSVDMHPPNIVVIDGMMRATNLLWAYDPKTDTIYADSSETQKQIQQPSGLERMKSVLSHELAHRYLQHRSRPDGACEGQINEIQADVIGGKIYGDLPRYREIMKDFLSQASGSERHPTGTDRLAVMGVALGSMDWRDMASIIDDSCKPTPETLEAFRLRHSPTR